MSLRFCSDYRTLALGALASCCIWLGFPNDFVALAPLALFWPVALYYLGFISANWRKAFLSGWLATSFGFMLALYWLALPVAQVGGLPWPAAFACAILIALALALQGGVFATLVSFFKKCGLLQRFLLVTVAWYLLEYGFALVLGFPWLPLAGALAQWPVFIQAADIFGSYLLGAIWFAAALLLSFGRCRPFIAGCAVICLLLGYGVWRLEKEPLEKNPQGPDTIACLLVEGNVDQNQKWVAAFQRSTLELYINLTNEGLRGIEQNIVSEKPLIIWPETALPFFYEKNLVLAQWLEKAVQSFACPLLFGAPGIEIVNGKEEIYNRAFLLAPSGKELAHYDKEHLVPFGEYVPVWLKLDFLDALLQGVGVYNEGQNPQPLKYDSLALGVLICYEGIFPWLAAERVANGANILVDISNDGWFGSTPAARQHLYLTVLRCVEQGRWLLRGTNTGISAVADSRGRLVVTGAMFCAESLAVRARLLGCSTIYASFGYCFPLMAVIIFAGIYLCCLRVRKNVSFE